MTFIHARRASAVAVLASAAVLLTSGAATPPAQIVPEQILVTADLDGDGVPDPVTLQQISPGTQLLRVALSEEILDATVGGDDSVPLPLTAPRPSDLDGDGRAELVLTVAVGANTTTYEVWRYDDLRGLHAVTGTDGAPWHLYEGGGVAAISGYGCIPGEPRRPYAVEARWDESRPEQEPIRYDGEIVTYDLADVARPVSTAAVQDLTRDDPRLKADPATCTP
jgi:hypothetical protein